MVNEIITSLPRDLRERCRAVNDVRVSENRDFGLYWMSTAMRVEENPALSVAACLANGLGLPLFVYQGLSERYPYASDRFHTFILEGARDVQGQMERRDIAYAFHLEQYNSRQPVLRELADRAAFVVTEDIPVDPLRGWRTKLAAAEIAPVLAVDSACVLPMQLVTKPYTRAFQFREATAAQRTDRLFNKIVEIWPEKSTVPGSLPFQRTDLQARELAELVAGCEVDHAVGPIPHSVGGSKAGYARWNNFVKHGIRSYHKRRNNALLDGVSRMSPYLHFGMVAPQRLAREAAEVGGEGAEKFLDELLIWRELAYTFCFHREDHERLSAIPKWAQDTLELHRCDNRPSIKSWETLARGNTGDTLWDAAQQSLLMQGELHNNVRMTWGKQFLQWTPDAASALRSMVDLNHRYALDGRDPSSYGGLLWCLGQFDRAFTPEQPVIGTVRPRPTYQHARRLDLESYRAKVQRPFVDPMPRVAVVGAGLSGMMCARTLLDHGYHVEVFEKSRGFGGRMATRRIGDFRFDHGAQYFTVRDERFARYVESWQEDGVVAKWEGRIAVLGRSESIEFSQHTERYVALPGMNGLVKHLGRDVTVHLQTRIGKLAREGGRWHLFDGHRASEALGEFDFVVLAIPAGQATELLPLESELQQRAACCQMNPCWASMFAFPRKLHDSYEAAFVHNSSISWIARNASKPERPSNHETWIVQASSDWSRAHEGECKERIAEQLLRDFGKILHASELQPMCSTAHFWRYAIPETALVDTCLFDGDWKLAACGDWCAGPRVEGAFLSGAAVAGRIMGHCHATWTSAHAAS